jgi:hypothetical protein
MNKITLSKGEIVFSKWTNLDRKEIQRIVYVDPIINNIIDEKLKQDYIDGLTAEWLVAASIFRGLGFLKGKTLKETYENIQALDILEINTLGNAFAEFYNTELKDLKKK